MTHDTVLCIQILQDYVEELKKIDNEVILLKERREVVLQLKRDLMNELKDLQEYQRHETTDPIITGH